MVSAMLEPFHRKISTVGQITPVVVQVIVWLEPVAQMVPDEGDVTVIAAKTALDETITNKTIVPIKLARRKHLFIFCVSLK
jgi:hypothetical protein